MKPEIHPKYELTSFTCACGAAFQINSTMGGSSKIEICSSCHPLFTGKEKLMDTEGRIERFRKKYKTAETK